MSSKSNNLPPQFVAEDGLLLVHPDSMGQRVRLRYWFAPFAAWLIVLFAMMHADPFSLAGSELGFRVRLMIFLTLYLSLACTFIPLPTTPLIVWAATESLGLESLEGNGFLERLFRPVIKWLIRIAFGSSAMGVGLADNPWIRVCLISSVGAFATMLANLNDYHILTGILRARKVASVRNTRLYRAAIRWFSKSAWLTVYAFALIPIPVDVIRLLAITFRYPRWRFATACYAGRFTRYSILTFLIAIMFDNQENVQLLLVLAITVLTIGAGLTIGLPKLVRMIRGDGSDAHRPKGKAEAQDVP